VNEPLAELRFGDVLTFLTVHRCGAITAAARALKVTPSQVSKAVHRLERQLGATLLSRSTRGVIVSDAGRRLIPQLEEVSARLQMMRPDAVPREELALAAPSYLNAIFLPRIAAALPDALVRGLELPPALVRAYAVENFFDVALLVGAEQLPGGWATTTVGHVRKGLFAAPDVARKLGTPPIDPRRVAELPFVTPIYNVNGQFVPADDGCPLTHTHRRLGHQSQTLMVGLDLARATGHLVFGPAIGAAAHLARGELVEVCVRGWEVSEPLTVAVNAERVRARTQRLLSSLVQRTLSELDG
jgi:DNA-binding transcriptional LysR family regulator